MLDKIVYTKPAAPADIDVPRFGNADEARKIRRLIRFLKDAGFKVHSVAVDGEGTYVRTPTERGAVCEVFEWDALVTLRFYRKGQPDNLHGVLLVTGNGDDIISDYSCDAADVSKPEPGTFSAAMDAFYAADESREV